MSFVLGCFKRF